MFGFWVFCSCAQFWVCAVLSDTDRHALQEIILRFGRPRGGARHQIQKGNTNTQDDEEDEDEEDDDDDDEEEEEEDDDDDEDFDPGDDDDDDDEGDLECCKDIVIDSGSGPAPAPAPAGGLPFQLGVMLSPQALQGLTWGQ